MTGQRARSLARELSELESTARQAGADAQSALHDAASALARGDTAAAQDALNRLGDALQHGPAATSTSIAT